MYSIKRRHFLQVAGSTLGAIGISHLDLVRQGDRYGRAIAQATPRKLALLIGINNYQSWFPLHGCENDVSLQRELLVHRFGFQQSDIVTLVSAEATRTRILEAFEEHLIKQAREDDVIVVHFSGHGDLVTDPDPISGSGCNGSLVPVDGQASSSRQVSYIMGRTIFLLMSALKTNNVTFVLDSCFSGGGTRGNVQIRSIGTGGACSNPSTDELEYQNRWLTRLRLSPQQFRQRRREFAAAKGVVLASAQPRQLAVDYPFDDGAFPAGFFTYFLTQYLWEQSNNRSFAETLSVVQNRMQSFQYQQPRLQDQQPLLAANPQENKEKSVYFISNLASPAEAVIRNRTGNRVEIWLGGVAVDSLPAFRGGAILSVVNPASGRQERVRISSRNGLLATAQFLDDPASPIATGTLLQESVRQLPRPGELNLRIGLDDSLGADIPNIEQALRAINRVTIVPLQQAEVDYIIGRMTASTYEELLKRQVPNPPPTGSIGLFSAGLTPILVGESFGTDDEKPEASVRRLSSRLNRLLALRILRTALNASSSLLDVVASVIADRRNSQSLYRTTRGREQRNNTEYIQFRSGSDLKFQIKNNESSPLYIVVLVTSSRDQINILSPALWEAPEENMRLEPSQSTTIPRQEDGFEFKLSGTGDLEVIIIASSNPLRNFLRFLSYIERGKSPAQPDAVEVAEKLLTDLNGRNGANTTQLAALYIDIKSIE